MYKELLEEFFQSEVWPPDKKLIQQFAQNPDESVPVLLQTIDERDKVDGSEAIGLLGLIGYPGNTLAIPTLVQFLGADHNDPRYLATVDALFPIGPDIVVPHLIRALLDKGEPYHIVHNDKKTSWANDIEGICWTISTPEIDPEYARRCCPTVNALLLQADPELDNNVCLSALLDVIKRSKENIDYTIPAMIELIKRHPESKIGQKARQILTTFKQQAVETYALLNY